LELTLAFVALVVTAALADASWSAVIKMIGEFRRRYEHL
jgi:hypothetical protein